tara:strand:+ start:711 stop:1424 length:714 start_codon:yes stop_codon:yes gene_type:complete
MDIKKQIKIALGLENDEVKLGWQSKSEDGTILVSTAEELEAGVDISVLTEDGTTIPLPIGTYKLDTGVSFRVEEEGVVAEVIESETEEEDTAEEEDLSTDLAEEDKEDYDEEDDRKETADVGDWRGMEKRIQNLEDAVADLKRQIGETGDVEEMSEETEEPSTNPKSIKTTEVVEFSAEEEIEKLKAENEKLKTELNAKPADNPVNVNKFSTDKPVLSRKDYNKLSKRERFLYNLNK